MSVAMKRRRDDPDIRTVVNRIGTWRKKYRMLAKKEELIAFFDSSYKRFKTNPLDRISSENAVANARIMKKRRDEIVMFEGMTNFPVLMKFAEKALRKKSAPAARPKRMSERTCFERR